MADKTGIEWTEATWNPVTGCSKVSAGCKYCYAERDWARLQHLSAYTGRAFTDVALHADRLDIPVRWQRARRIFVNSMSDLFHADVSFEFIAAVFGVMAGASWHTFQVLTKRPARALEFFRWIEENPERQDFDCPDFYAKFPDDDWCPFFLAQKASEFIANGGAGLRVEIKGKWPLPNVWLGVSVEDQSTADERIPLLLQTPAAVRWISAEPLLGPVDLSEHLMCLCGMCGGDSPLHWVVVGGESGPKARPMHPDWVRSLRDQCQSAGVPFLFKQWGEFAPKYWTPFGIYPVDHEPSPAAEVAAGRWVGPCEERLYRVGKKAAGRVLDGVPHDGYPEA